MYQKNIYHKVMARFKDKGANGIEEFAKEYDLSKVELGNDEYLDEVVDWCKEICPNDYFYYFRTFYFTRKNDAIMFALKWS